MRLHPLWAPLAPRATANQQSAGGWGCHTVRGGVDQGDRRFLPWLIRGVYMHGGISEPGMGSLPHRLRWDLDDYGWNILVQHPFRKEPAAYGRDWIDQSAATIAI